MKKGFGYIIFFTLLLYFVKGTLTYTYALTALSIWFEKLVPSLFVSMVLIRLLYASGVLMSITHLFKWLIEPLFHIDSNTFALVIASILLGFPTGCIFIDDEVKKGYLQPVDAKRLICCCCFATPGFILLSCGVILYQSISIGITLFIISCLSGFCLLLITRNQPIQVIQPHDLHHPPFFTCFTQAMIDSGKALFMIGGYLMIVMSMTSLLLPYLPKYLALFFQVITEFSNGTILLSTLPISQTLKLILTASLFAFGGLCVHLQVFSLCSHSQLHYPSYLAWRVLQAVLAGMLALLIF